MDQFNLPQMELGPGFVWAGNTDQSQGEREVDAEADREKELSRDLGNPEGTEGEREALCKPGFHQLTFPASCTVCVGPITAV